MEITAIKAFSDNYIWMIKNKNDSSVVIVDPGDAKPVVDILRKQKLTLSAILITHWHADHIGGVSKLCQLADIPVIGPDQHIPEVTQAVTEGDTVSVAGHNFRVIEVPGHTLDHVAYFCADSPQSPLLFSGDTLFVAGCGRIFEGSHSQMYESLQKLAVLPTDTHVYCAHEYTAANLAFATAVEPNNEAIRQLSDEVDHKCSQGIPTVPSTLQQELATNPFLRTDQAEVILSAKQRAVDANSPAAVFASLRQWKDNF